MTLASVLFTWVLHELAHWSVGELLGNEMKMSLNSAGPVSGHYNGHFHNSIVTIAGPIFTVAEAFVAYRILKKDGDLHWLPVLITCVYMRILAGFMNLSQLNDEGKISLKLGIGKFTLPLLVAAILIWWCRSLLVRRSYSRPLLWGTLGMVMLFSSILILADQFFHLHII